MSTEERADQKVYLIPYAQVLKIKDILMRLGNHVLLGSLLVLSISAMGGDDSNLTLSDYQKRVSELESNNTVAAVEELMHIYGEMANIARSQGDESEATKYNANMNHMYLILIEAEEYTQQIIKYQASLGINESELMAKIDASENQVRADPLNVSSWHKLSDEIKDLVTFHAHDNAYQTCLVIKEDVNTAMGEAEDIQKYGIDQYKYMSGRSYSGGEFTDLVTQAAEKMAIMKKNNDRMMQLRAAYESQLAIIANDSDKATEADDYLALAYDYIALSDAINNLDEFNRSINNTFPSNDTAFMTCRMNAIRCFDSAIKTAGSDPVSSYWLAEGRVYNALGDRNNANRCFDQGITSAIEEQDNETLIGCLYLKAKNANETEAIEYYQRILSYDPYDSRIWKALSQIYKKLGRYKEASDANDYAEAFKHESRSTLPRLPLSYYL